jgi:hypothetical protein
LIRIWHSIICQHTKLLTGLVPIIIFDYYFINEKVSADMLHMFVYYYKIFYVITEKISKKEIIDENYLRRFLTTRIYKVCFWVWFIFMFFSSRKTVIYIK